MRTQPIQEPRDGDDEELIRALLPLLPDAEVTEDNDGQIVIRTGLTSPLDPG